MAFSLSKKVAVQDAQKEKSPYASAEKRIYACAIDLLLVIFLLLLVHQFQLLLFAQFVYFSFFWWMFYGQTFGNEFMKIRVVTEKHEPLSFGRAVLRALGFLVAEVTIIGFLWILFDKKRQGLHDKIAHTIVIPTS